MSRLLDAASRVWQLAYELEQRTREAEHAAALPSGGPVAAGTGGHADPTPAALDTTGRLGDRDARIAALIADRAADRLNRQADRLAEDLGLREPRKGPRRDPDGHPAILTSPGTAR